MAKIVLAELEMQDGRRYIFRATALAFALMFIACGFAMGVLVGVSL